MTVSIYKELLGKRHPNVAFAKHHRALLLENLGRHAEALALYKHVLTMQTTSEGAGNTLRSMGVLLGLHMGKPAEGLVVLEKAQNALNACDRPDLSAAVFFASGQLLHEQGKLADASLVFAKALAIRKERYGESHIAYAEAACSMASVLLGQGKYAKALALFEPAQVAATAALGENHTNAAWT